MNPYEPEPLPPEGLDWRMLAPLVGRANAALARYDGLLQGIPNPAVLLSPLTTREAVLSSRIEGTQATMDEVLEHEAGLEKGGEKSKDIQEIVNYRQAMLAGREQLRTYPIRLAFVRGLHETLMRSVRGKDKSPGAFRLDQNWIGAPGCAQSAATFVPPAPMQLPGHLEAWERYLAREDGDPLTQAGVAHAQFELLHPFKDGNGRIGRILIPLFLYQRGLLSEPMFYLSGYLEEHREAYYAGLQGISARRDWNGWLQFFLCAVEQQAGRNSARVKAIMALYEEMKGSVHTLTRSRYTVHLLDAIFSRPVFRATDVAKRLKADAGVHEKTTAALLRALTEAGALRVVQAGVGRRSAVLCFPRLIAVTEGMEEV